MADKLCRECKERPRLTWRNATMCRECQREYNRFKLAHYRARPRPCATCRQIMPPSTSDYCNACSAAHERERRNRYPRYCPQCREVLPHGRQNDYCSDCQSVRHHIARVGRVRWQQIVSGAREAE